MIIVVVRQQKSTRAVEASVAAGRWKSGLESLLARTARAFRRVESRRNARLLVTAMMAHLDRRNCRTLAEAAGEAGPWRFQHLLSRATWDDAQVRSEIRAWVSEHLGDGPRVLAVDETGDVKKGASTVGSSGSTRGQPGV